MTDSAQKKRKRSSFKETKILKRFKVKHIKDNWVEWSSLPVELLKEIFKYLDSETLRNILSFLSLFEPKEEKIEMTNVGLIFWNYDFWVEKIKRDYEFNFSRTLDVVIAYARVNRDTDWDETNLPHEKHFQESHKTGPFISKIGKFYFHIANFYDHIKNRFITIPESIKYYDKILQLYTTISIVPFTMWSIWNRKGGALFIDFEVINKSPTSIILKYNTTVGYHNIFRSKTPKEAKNILWGVDKGVLVETREFALGLGKNFIDLKHGKLHIPEDFMPNAPMPQLVYSNKLVFYDLSPKSETPEGWIFGALEEVKKFERSTIAIKRIQNNTPPKWGRVALQNFDFTIGVDLGVNSFVKKPRAKMDWWEGYDFLNESKIKSNMQIPLAHFNKSPLVQTIFDGMDENEIAFDMGKIDFFPLGNIKDGSSRIELSFYQNADQTINNFRLWALKSKNDNLKSAKKIIRALTLSRKVHIKSDSEFEEQMLIQQKMQRLFLFGGISFLSSDKNRTDDELTAYEIMNSTYLERDKRLEELFQIIEEDQLIRARKNILLTSKFSNKDYCHNRSCFKKFNSNCRAKKCTGCHFSLYCSKECQLEDWNHNHKNECYLKHQKKWV